MQQAQEKVPGELRSASMLAWHGVIFISLTPCAHVEAVSHLPATRGLSSHFSNPVAPWAPGVITHCLLPPSSRRSHLARSAIPYSLYHYVMRLPFPSNTPQSELRLHCVEHNTPLQVGHTSSRGSQKRPTTYLSKALRPLAPHNKVTTPPYTNEPASSTPNAHYL